MGKGSFKRHPVLPDSRTDRFECTSSDAARSASLSAGSFAASAVIKRAETAFVGDPECSDNAETAFVTRFGFRFAKTVEKYSAFDGTEASAVSFQTKTVGRAEAEPVCVFGLGNVCAEAECVRCETKYPDDIIGRIFGNG